MKRLKEIQYTRRNEWLLSDYKKNNFDEGLKVFTKCLNFIYYRFYTVGKKMRYDEIFENGTENKFFQQF